MCCLVFFVYRFTLHPLVAYDLKWLYGGYWGYQGLLLLCSSMVVNYGTDRLAEGLRINQDLLPVQYIHQIPHTAHTNPSSSSRERRGGGGVAPSLQPLATTASSSSPHHAHAVVNAKLRWREISSGGERGVVERFATSQ